MELSERKESILSAVIEHFISTGVPVGSKFLAAVLPVAVSPATIRNEMASLADEGFLDQPHTSAGRVPSDKGYRYYIDRFLPNFQPSDSDVFRLLSAVDRSEGDADITVSQMAGALSDVTGCTVVATTPDSSRAVITGADAVPVNLGTVMIMLNTSLGTVKSRLVKTVGGTDIGSAELFRNTVASNFASVPLSDITRADVQSAAAGLGEKALDLLPLLASFYDCVSDTVKVGVTVKGQSELLTSPDLRADAPAIIELLRDPEAVGEMLAIRSDAPVETRIGSENRFHCLRHAAVIRAAYKRAGEYAGTFAVIAPTKTDYSRVIPLLKFAGEETGRMLSTDERSE